MQIGEEIHTNTHAAASHFCGWTCVKAVARGRVGFLVVKRHPNDVLLARINCRGKKDDILHQKRHLTGDGRARAAGSQPFGMNGMKVITNVIVAPRAPGAPSLLSRDQRSWLRWPDLSLAYSPPVTARFHPGIRAIAATNASSAASRKNKQLSYSRENSVTANIKQAEAISRTRTGDRHRIDHGWARRTCTRIRVPN
jgi:hypothetical protein